MSRRDECPMCRNSWAAVEHYAAQRAELLAACEALLAALKYVGDANVPNIEHGKRLAAVAVARSKESP